jgi:hypothetical protein
MKEVLIVLIIFVISLAWVIYKPKDGYVSGTMGNSIAGFTPETARIFAFMNNKLKHPFDRPQNGQVYQEQTTWQRMAKVPVLYTSPRDLMLGESNMS